MKMQIRRMAVWVLLVCLLAGIVPVPAAAAGFRDVPSSSWAAQSIARCVEQGWFQGESATTFGMGHPMTRAAFAVVLCRYFGWEMVTPEKGTYEDVQDPSAWYYSAVETAYANGAITRQSDTFRPADSITREEMAAMLVRALGYGTIAGLAQEVSAPFTDTTTNAGYIAMAYELGIVNGTSSTTFEPDKAATREQVAVILDRLDQKLSGGTLTRLGVVSSEEDAQELDELDVAAVSAGRLVYNGNIQVSIAMEDKTLSAIRDAVEQSGATELLRVSGGSSALSGTVVSTATALADAVEQGGYDGILLDLSNLRDDQKTQLTKLVQQTAAKLGDKLLYVMADAPDSEDGSTGAYDLAALGSAADKLVLRVDAYEKTAEELTVAPLEPLEEFYSVLAQLNGVVAAEKLSVCISTRGVCWVGEKRSGTMDAQQIREVAEDGAECYYSNRYEAAYLTWEKGGKQAVVWYLDSRALEAREQMLRLFGVGQVCFQNLTERTTQLPEL